MSTTGDDGDSVDERLEHAAACLLPRGTALERPDPDKKAIVLDRHRELETLVKGCLAEDVGRQRELVDTIDRKVEARPEAAEDERDDARAAMAGRDCEDDGLGHVREVARRITVDDGTSGMPRRVPPSTLSTMTPEDLTLTTEVRADSTVLHVAGELDLSTVAVFDAELERALALGPVVVVLSECTFIDSSALQSLVRAHRGAPEHEQHGALALVAPSQPARRVLEIAALDRLVPIFDTLDDALASTA